MRNDEEMRLSEADQALIPAAEGVQMTDQEFADWLGKISPEGRLFIARTYRRVQTTAGNCLIQNHAGLKSEIDWMRSRLRRYQLAWHSARRNRIHPTRLLTALREQQP